MFLSLLVLLNINKLKVSFCLILFYFFLSKNWFGFFVGFECSVIPILLMILLLGVKPERIEARIFILSYTLVGGVPLLLSVVYIFLKINSFNYRYLSYSWFLYIFIVFFILGFLIKIPIYGLHSWLPKAHVEASVGGSMILAAILLKLGVYGFFRLKSFFHLKIYFLRECLLFLILFFCLVGGFLCFRSIDLKSTIAYSSIVHMNLVIGSLLFYSGGMVNGLVAMSIAHGYIRRLMFYLFYSFYKESKSRSSLVKNFLGVRFPLFVVLWFVVCAFKSSVPPRFALVGELQMFTLIGVGSSVWFLALVMLVFRVGVYKIFIFIMIYRGFNSLVRKKFNETKRVSLIISTSYIFFLIVLIMVWDVVY